MYTLLRYEALTGAPRLGILVFRVIGYGTYTSHEDVEAEINRDSIPAVAGGLLILARDPKRDLATCEAIEPGRPMGSLKAPILDWRASGIHPILPDLEPGMDPPPWFAAAMSRLPDAFFSASPAGALHLTIVIPPTEPGSTE